MDLFWSGLAMAVGIPVAIILFSVTIYLIWQFLKFLAGVIGQIGRRLGHFLGQIIEPTLNLIGRGLRYLWAKVMVPISWLGRVSGKLGEIVSGQVQREAHFWQANWQGVALVGFLLAFYTMPLWVLMLVRIPFFMVLGVAAGGLIVGLLVSLGDFAWEWFDKRRRVTDDMITAFFGSSWLTWSGIAFIIGVLKGA